jgi:hypothetical protein
VALEGELDIHAGRQRMALLREGEAIKLEPRIAHITHQHGTGPGTSGAALWPGAVEKALKPFENCRWLRFKRFISAASNVVECICCSGKGQGSRGVAHQ